MFRRLLIPILMLLTVALAGYAAVMTRQMDKLFYERAGLRVDPNGLGVHAAANRALTAPVDTVIIGDSRIAMWNPAPSTDGKQVAWRGIGGQSSAQVAGRFAQDVLSVKPKAVVIAVGVNDIMAAAALGLPASADELIVDNIKAMATQAREAGVQVHVATVVRPHVPGWSKRWHWPDGVHARTTSVNDVLRAQAQGRWCLLEFDGALAANDASPLPATWAADDLHLNAAAYTRLNAVLEQALRKGCHGL